MLHFLKVFGRGVLVTVLLPFILLVLVVYGVYCIGLFIFTFFKSTIEFFQGKTFDAELPEDLEARRILLEKEQQEAQAKEALSMMYKHTITETINPPQEGEPIPHNPYEENPEPFGGDSYESDADGLPIDNDYGEYDDDIRRD